MSNIILSNSSKALLISRNPSRFHVNFVLSCSIRSRGIRSAAINLSTSCSVSIPVANPPIRMTHHSSKKRSEEHTSELQSRFDLVCRLLLEKKNKKIQQYPTPP